MNSIELFAGAGGMSLGLEKSGWKSKMLAEYNHHACNTLRFNRDNGNELSKNWNIIEDDVRNIDYGSIINGNDQIDLVAGGPPCQPFSLGGKHNGKDDARDMFPEAIRAVRDLQPKYFMFENVKGLLRKSFSDYFNYILLRLKFPFEGIKDDEEWSDHLKKLLRLDNENIAYGSKYTYRITWKLVNAVDYGIPQHRHRVIIVGVREDQNWEFTFPEKTHCIDKLLYSKYVSNDYWDLIDVPFDDDIHHYKTLAKKIEKLEASESLFASHLQPTTTVYEAIKTLPKPFEVANEEYPNHIIRLGAKPYPGHTGSGLYFPSKAIKAGNHGVPGGENMIAYPDGTYRYYTTREAARIQTFPDNYIFTGSWTESMRQIGNAVPVNLGFILGSSLYEQATGIDKDVKEKRTLQSA